MTSGATDDDAFRDAARPVHATARALTPPTARDARRRQQRQARRVVAGGAALLVLGAIGLLATRGPAGQDLAVGTRSATAGSSVPDDATGGPGSTVGTSPGVVGTSPPSMPEPPTSTAAPEPTAAVTSIPASAPTSTSIPGPSSTTTTSPPTTTPPTSAPPSLGGPYTAIEHYALFTDRCPDISHHLDGTVTFATGAWTYVADYCGQNGADNIWRGTGTVLLTAPDGSTLAGTFHSQAPVGTSGEPYDVTITTGTGAWSGAGGTCRVVVHLREIQFGEQEQTGTITCMLTRP